MNFNNNDNLIKLNNNYKVFNVSILLSVKKNNFFIKRNNFFIPILW